MLALRTAFFILLPALAAGFLMPTPSLSKPFSIITRSRGVPARLPVTALNSWGGKKQKTTRVAVEPEVIAPDYRVAAGFFLGGVGLALPPLSNPGAGLPLALIGAFLASRTQKVRFVFDEEAMEVMTVGADGQSLSMERENFAVGGRNRWTYASFTNWEFYPSEQVPVLVYFKETQTKPEGQIHFFPVIGNPARLLENFRKYVPLPGK
ncbi:hypothetical protein NGA_0681310 [Nannochloropsis gaditana CCMP526]|uniref:uncharacterized protein n=1 Tax=Nannochloropsis gaditana (strain CCMP526) TaxID=1093141 RepID=UPI00029F554B|nr:hypothetical protein NGA_0681310 [Nannochloropsis gaditana CCMP526]EKU23128.1 hypothetical protein NGA_0681310 [Nannochloropsis gaditana CCMP526]|eukprot:XP_005852703.1 hypothetical protein NGA_0681310 [Nannochloropsis gaditana CCMP526]